MANSNNQLKPSKTTIPQPGQDASGDDFINYNPANDNRVVQDFFIRMIREFNNPTGKGFYDWMKYIHHDECDCFWDTSNFIHAVKLMNKYLRDQNIKPRTPILKTFEMINQHLDEDIRDRAKHLGVELINYRNNT